MMKSNDCGSVFKNCFRSKKETGRQTGVHGLFPKVDLFQSISKESNIL